MFLPMYTKFYSATLPGSAQNKLMKITLFEKQSEIYMPNRDVSKGKENVAKLPTNDTGDPVLYFRRTLFMKLFSVQ